MSKLWPTGGQRRARVDLASSPMYFQRLEFESESVIACKINICSRNLFGDGNGNPLQCSCLENPRDGGAWWAVVYGVAQSRTRLKQLSSSSRSMSRCQTRGWLRWFAHPLGSVLCRRHAQHPAFAPGSLEVAVAFSGFFVSFVQDLS